MKSKNRHCIQLGLKSRCSLIVAVKTLLWSFNVHVHVMSYIHVMSYFNSLKKLLNEKKTPKQKSFLSSLYVINHVGIDNKVVDVIIGLIKGILHHLPFHLLLN